MLRGGIADQKKHPRVLGVLSSQKETFENRCPDESDRKWNEGIRQLQASVLVDF